MSCANFPRAKFFLALLLGFALAWAQMTVAAGPATTNSSPSRAKCSCAAKNCCVARSASVPHPMPAPLAKTVGQDSLFLSPPPLRPVFDLPASIAFPFSKSSSLRVVAVPLYRQNCSYLI